MRYSLVIPILAILPWNALYAQSRIGEQEEAAESELQVVRQVDASHRNQLQDFLRHYDPGASAPLLRQQESAVKHTPWKWVGPYNAAGQAWAVAFDATNDSILLAGFAHGTTWRSTNLGTTWTRVSAADDPIGSYGFAQDLRPGKQNIWYSVFSSVVAKSLDSGKSWSRLTMPPNFHDGNSISLDYSRLDKDVVMIDCGIGVIRSEDGGTSWSITLPNDPNRGDLVISKTGECFASISNGLKYGIWRSADGVTWTKITRNFPYVNGNVLDLELAPSDQNILYIYTNNIYGDVSGSSKAIWRLNVTDTSARWKRVWSGTLLSQGEFTRGFAVTADDPNILYIGTVLLYRVTLLGDTGSERIVGGIFEDSHLDYHALALSPLHPSWLMVGSDGGPAICKDLSPLRPTWTSLAHGIASSLGNGIALDHAIPGSEKLVIGLWDNPSYITRVADGRTPWIPLYPSDAGVPAMADSGRFYYVQDHGSTMTRYELDTLTGVVDTAYVPPNVVTRSLPMEQPSTNSPIYQPYCMDPTDNRFLYLAVNGGLFRTGDAQIEWAYPAPVVRWVRMLADKDLGWISLVGVSREPKHSLWIVADSGIYRLDSSTSDGGELVRLLTPQFFANGSVPRGIWVGIDQSTDSEVMIALSGTLLSTTDRGATWASVFGNLLGYYNGYTPGLGAVGIVHTGSSRVYIVGTNAGLFTTNHLAGEQTRWSLESPEEIGPASISWMDIRQSDGYVALSSWGRGAYAAWYYEEPDPASVGTAIRSIDVVRLSDNPVETRSRISFTTDRPGVVCCTVIDSKGSTVLTPFERWFDSGPQESTLDLSSIPAGVYTLALSLNGAIATTRAVVLR